VFDRVDDSPSKEMGPHAIDHRPGKILVLRRGDPFGHRRPIGHLVELRLIALEELGAGGANGPTWLRGRWNGDDRARRRALLPKAAEAARVCRRLRGLFNLGDDRGPIVLLWRCRVADLAEEG